MIFRSSVMTPQRDNYFMCIIIELLYCNGAQRKSAHLHTISNYYLARGETIPMLELNNIATRERNLREASAFLSA